MPIFTSPISQQNTASSAGNLGYPALGSVKQYVIVSDEFNRETLNPTNAIALYTSANNQGTGTSAISGTNVCAITTTGITNDDVSLRTSGIAFNRKSEFIDNRSNMQFDMVFTLSTANQQIFVGIVQQSTQLTGLPTTTRHLGIYYDTSASTNFFLSSANGSSQTTTDTGVAASGTPLYRIQIVWTGDDSATITFYSVTLSSTSLTWSLLKTQTVTSLINGASFFAGWEVHFYNKTLANATKALNIREWDCQAT